ncbi:response regulator [Arcobacter sp. FWKO B]|uniref:response regulator n=1 Tax=Arcobacter sp. FWKO B TaxID=2593672 RepID=UPI0018A3A670|nr:response regulator [Arcobacter sp. FWKO B]QOG12754.1 response regulator [Arcobacter sp. FWKO B]
MDTKYKIAIVDDESEILNMLSRFLQRSGKYEIVTFLNPLTALSTIDSTYDAVLLDIMMPQMGGLEVLEKLIEKNPEQKVIMMTAYSTLDRVLKSHKVGATHYLMKPFNSLDAVEKKLQDVLQS